MVSVRCRAGTPHSLRFPASPRRHGALRLAGRLAGRLAVRIETECCSESAKFLNEHMGTAERVDGTVVMARFKVPRLTWAFWPNRRGNGIPYSPATRRPSRGPRARLSAKFRSTLERHAIEQTFSSPFPAPGRRAIVGIERPGATPVIGRCRSGWTKRNGRPRG